MAIGRWKTKVVEILVDKESYGNHELNMKQRDRGEESKQEKALLKTRQLAEG